MNWGLLGPTDAVDDVVDVLDFSRRFNLAYHRNDGHIYQQGVRRPQPVPARAHAAGVRGRPARRDARATGCTRPTKLSPAVAVRVPRALRVPDRPAQQRPVQLRREPPDDRARLLRAHRGRLPLARRHRHRIPLHNLTIPIVFKDTNFHLMDDWASFEAEPTYDATTSPPSACTPPTPHRRLPAGRHGERGRRSPRPWSTYREILNQATADLWKRIAGWSRDQMIDAGALVYSWRRQGLRAPRRHLRPGRLVPVDDRVQRFKPLMNDEYGA